MEKNESTTRDYLRIIKGLPAPPYISPEEQGKRLKRCTILKEANFNYSNYTQGVESLKQG